jgi:hypothetical protein
VSVAYVDSSCVVAVTLGERSARAVQTAFRSRSRLVSSNLLAAEVLAVLAREGATANPATFARIDWVFPNEPLNTHCQRVLAVGRLRGADLWHLATALWVADDPSQVTFLTLDVDQRRVAAALGFRTS